MCVYVEKIPNKEFIGITWKSPVGVLKNESKTHPGPLGKDWETHLFKEFIEVLTQ